jgi:hypothetical protein
VPRNTKIVITFKEPVCDSGNLARSIIDTKGTTDVSDDMINSQIVKIYPKPQTGVAPQVISDVKAFYTSDKKTFTFRPVDYLGNDQTPTWYVVELTNALKKADCTTDAFGGFGGYNWSFEVSTVLDLTPPQIESVIPKAVINPVTVARNTVIQINFNEAIDPTTLAGKSVVDSNGALAANSYDLMTVKTADNYVAGEFYFSNQYRTVEFITNDPCGINSCGDQVYCLPASADISVLVKAATLDVPTKPTAKESLRNGIFYDGLVDMCSNSLDGNKDGIAQGPSPAGVAYSLNSATGTGDYATWKFNTNNLIDLIPPQIETRNPENNTPDVNPDSDLNLAFDKTLLSSSLIQDDSLTLDQGSLVDQQKSSYWFEKNEINNKTMVIIKTSGLQNNYTYNLIANFGIKDITQNCYLPCADIGNCARKVTNTPGQYEVGSPWIGTYPSCNLAQ